jgi:hypothetical protein
MDVTAQAIAQTDWLIVVESWDLGAGESSQAVQPQRRSHPISYPLRRSHLQQYNCTGDRTLSNPPESDRPSSRYNCTGDRTPSNPPEGGDRTPALQFKAIAPLTAQFHRRSRPI